ncbi:MAG TPA: DMT family transporter [Chitinophagaceae bacterium]|jgi:drug/metabolite transporter (DMT)-like permease|nr:DMT family transporter [Chitinophagaceae bacterium]
MKKAFIQLHIAVFLAGFTGLLGRLISLNEGMLVWYRLLLTAITMWILFLWMKKIKRIPKADILKIAGVGLIAMLHWLTFYASIKYANVSVGVLCFSAIGFFTAIFEPLITRKKFDPIELLLGIATIGGIYIIFHFDTQYKTGIIIGIISAVFASLFPIFNRQFLKRINVETMLAWQQTGGLIGLSALLPLYLHLFPNKNGFIPGWEDFGWLLVLSWCCSVIAFQLSSNALKHLSAFTVNLTYNLEPLYGIVLAFVVYKENELLSKWFYVGTAIIMAALIIHVILLRKQQKKQLTHAGQ